MLLFIHFYSVATETHTIRFYTWIMMENIATICYDIYLCIVFLYLLLLSPFVVLYQHWIPKFLRYLAKHCRQRINAENFFSLFLLPYKWKQLVRRKKCEFITKRIWWDNVNGKYSADGKEFNNNKKIVFFLYLYKWVA